MEKERFDESLLKKRILLLTGEITREKANILRNWLILLNSQSDKEIKLIIDSPGGEVVAALMLHDAILLSVAPVTCIVNGECSSSGMVILQAAKKRLMTKHSFLYLHPISAAFEKERIVMDEKVEEKFADRLRGARERQKFVYEILMKKTGWTSEEIKAKEEKLILAKEAKEFGLIDKVVEEYKIYHSKSNKKG